MSDAKQVDPSGPGTQTLLDQIEWRVRQAYAYTQNAEVAPAALLWPDRDGQLATAARALRDRLPMLTLGELDVTLAQGPAYWLRCAIARTIHVDSIVDWSAQSAPPIVYLPGVGRDDLRATQECPRALAPIAELQYRGQWFTHPNGKDWTVGALLANQERGLGLDVADDAATGQALVGALGELLALPMRRLAAQRIDANFLQQLLNPDPAARLLEWLDDPARLRARLEPAAWSAFVALCRTQYDFDPTTDGEVTGGRLLGQRKGAWSEVWRRFEDEPQRYSGVEERLRMGKPHDLFAGLDAAWPQANEDAEARLHAALSGLAHAPPAQVRHSMQTLWEEHRPRLAWVWAKLDRAPLALALEQLHRLAEHTAGGPSGGIPELAAAYAAAGWQADDAFLAALKAAPDADHRRAVAGAATALYRPWLDDHARALQVAIGPMANAGTYAPGPAATADKGVVTVFVDGLRLDLGHRLAERLGSLDVALGTALAALPTVTQSAKPALTPVPIGALVAGKDLGPARAGSGAKATIAVLRSLMAERGLQVLQGAETGDPAGCAWTEAGDLDTRGHDFGVALVDEIDRELDAVARRVKLLLAAGWARVDVVTDHGWLLLPGGLQKVELPPATVEVKKGRCARLKAGADVTVPTVPWHWDPAIRIALAPGAGCFEANKEYEHGGISLQECVVPRLTVRAGAALAPAGGAVITRIKWLGLMCRVEFENVAPGAQLDIRALPADPGTSVAQAVKETTSAGRQSLHVPDEDLEGEKAFVVVVGPSGEILAQRDVIIGANR